MFKCPDVKKRKLSERLKDSGTKSDAIIFILTPGVNILRVCSSSVNFVRCCFEKQLENSL